MDPYKRSVLSTIEQEDEENDDEQVKKTLRFFDSMLDEYLQDQEFEVKRPPRSHQSQSVLNLSSSIKPVAKTREFNPSERKSSSAFQKYIPRQTSSQVRRYTSENNLDQLHLLPKSAPSSDELSSRSSTKKSLSASQSHLPTLTEQPASLGITASLIDLSEHQPSKSGPLFRFVPPKELPPKKIYPPNIVKPQVIIPNITFSPLATPSIRSTDNHFHHENAVSPFKPLVSTKTTTTTTDPPALPRPQFHQSMLDLPVQSNDVSPTKQHAHYVRQNNPNNRPARYYPGPSTASLLTEPVNKWLQQMKDSSTMNPPGFDQRYRPQYYSRPAYVPQGNLYHFDAKPPLASRPRPSKPTYSHGNDLIVTTYL